MKHRIKTALEHCVEPSISYKFVKKLKFFYRPLAKILESENDDFLKKWPSPIHLRFFYMHGPIIFMFEWLIYITESIIYLHRRF